MGLITEAACFGDRFCCSTWYAEQEMYKRILVLCALPYNLVGG